MLEVNMASKYKILLENLEGIDIINDNRDL